MGNMSYDQMWNYYDRKAYGLFVSGAESLGLKPHGGYGVGRRNSRSSSYSYPSRLSVYDGLFGAVPAYVMGWKDVGFDALLPAQYARLASRVVTAMYVGSSRWKGADHVVPLVHNWVRGELVRVRQRWITRQMKGYRGMGGKHRGYELPDPVPLSEIIFTEYGVDPLSSARDFIYTEDEIESILDDGWYPKELFRGVLSFGGVESFLRGVRVLVAREDFVPKVPISFLPYDRYLADAIYRMYRFVNEVWENPDILDDVSRFVVYRRNDLYRDRRSLPVVLPDFGVSWGWLLYSMVWHVLTKFDSGLYSLGAQSTRLSRYVESSLGTYYVFPAVAPFKVHGNLFSWGVDEFLSSVNPYYAQERHPMKYEDSLADIGLRSAWRYYQPSASELLSDGQTDVLLPVQSIKRWFTSMGFTWIFGFGYLERSDDSYFYHYGDPYTSFGPTPFEDYSFEVMGRDRFWFNYRSVPFFEFMKKFVFMYLEMLRRHGGKFLTSTYVRRGFVDLDEVFGTLSRAFRDIPDDVLHYSDPSQFRELPFHVVFNMAMSIFPVIMYSDVLPFRVYHMQTLLYVWSRMHYLPNIVWAVDRETGSLRVAHFDGTRWYERLGWFPKITYASVTRAFVGMSFRRFSGDISALVESSAYTALNSWYMPGQLAYRVPYYDSATFELLISFIHNLYSSVDWSAVDATGGGKSISFFDDSTTAYLPYSWVPFFSKRSEGVTPIGLLARGYADHLLVWVARAYSLSLGKKDLSREILRILQDVFGADIYPRFRKYLRGSARVHFDRYISELGERGVGSESKVASGEGSSSEP